MPAHLFKVETYWRKTKKREVELNVDPTAPAVDLRKVLEDQVRKVNGSLNTDLSQWRILIRKRPTGQVYTDVEITSSGLTKAKRHGKPW